VLSICAEGHPFKYPEQAWHISAKDWVKISKYQELSFSQADLRHDQRVKSYRAKGKVPIE
jgi:hypothetical protein